MTRVLWDVDDDLRIASCTASWREQGVEFVTTEQVLSEL
jgi:hypothetical protein